MTTKQRQFEGVVVSDAMQKTIVVKVDRTKLHARYGKRYVVSKNYKVHDEKEECVPGDRILFEECRPLSRSKRWRLVQKLNAA